MLKVPPFRSEGSTLKGAVIFIQAHGRRRADVSADIRFVRVSFFLHLPPSTPPFSPSPSPISTVIPSDAQAHGGTTVGDPWAPMVTHLVVEVPSGHTKSYTHVLPASIDASCIHPDHDEPAARHGWSFEGSLTYTNRNYEYSKRGPVVVQAQWLQDSVAVGYPLLERQNWGGWIVR